MTIEPTILIAYVDGVCVNSGERVIRRMEPDSVNWSELCIEHPTGARLTCLHSGGHCILVHMAHEGDSGHSSRNPNSTAGDEVLEFLLSNGQVDEYPVSMTIPVNVARQACDYFLVTGQMYHGVTWHDDGT